MTPNASLLVFVSLFASADKGGGIRAFHLDLQAGTLTAARETRAVPHPFFLAVAPDRATLYSVWAPAFGGAEEEEVAAWRIVGRDGVLEPCGRQSTRGTASCFLETDSTGRTLLVANYSSGSVATLPIGPDGAPGAAASVQRHVGSSVNPDRQREPHAHAIIPAPPHAGTDGKAVSRFAYAADLGTDQILCYRFDPARATLEPHDPPFTKAPAGAGPRHLRFHPDGRTLYCINELANTVGVYGYDGDTGRLTERQIVSTLPAGFSGTSYTADLRVTPDGRFLYGTNRGHDSIATFRVAADGRLETADIAPSRGRGPQNIAITPDGRLLLCANMPGNNVVVFRIDADSGRLDPIGEPVAVTSPACFAIVP